MSENTMQVSVPTETQVSNPVVPSVPDINLDPAAFQTELAKIAAEQGLKLENGNAVPVQEQQPTQVQAVTQPEPQVQAVTQPLTEVPPKFQTPEGQIDVNKVEKSTIHAQQALDKYLAMEKELRSKQSEVNKLQQTQFVAPVPQNVQVNAQPQSFVPNPQGLTPEVINDALIKANGNPGKVLLDLQYTTYQAALAQARQENEAELAQLRGRFEAKERQSELQKIADTDPWVFSPEGIKTLGEIRQSKPWLNQAPEPWTEAYKSYKADQLMQSPSLSVQTPTPTAQTVRAPAPPVQAQARTNPATPSLSFLSQSPAALNQYLDSLPNDAARQAFFRTYLPGAK